MSAAPAKAGPYQGHTECARYCELQVLHSSLHYQTQWIKATHLINFPAGSAPPP